MPAQPGPPFPGFSLDHFNYGMQMGLDHSGNAQHPWESPFQSPYQQGPQGGFNPPGQPGMGDMPGPGMGVGPMGMLPQDASAYAGPQPQELQGDPNQPQQGLPGNGFAGPSPWGVWGDQDLINDPAYAQNATTKHPKWNRFLQYMQTPQAQDSLMLGMIMAQSSTDPMKALALAQQFREHQTQRAWQAQQAEMQREYGLQVAKTKAEDQKANKETANFNGQVSKLDAALRSAKVDPDKIMKDLGPVTPENIEDWKNATQRKVYEAGEATKQAKQLEADQKAKNTFLNQAHSIGSVVPNKFIKEGNPDYDEDFANTIKEVAAGKKQRDEMYRQHMTLSNKVLGQKSVILNKVKDEGQKEKFRSLFAQASVMAGFAAKAKTTLEQMRPFSGMEGGFQDTFVQAQKDYNDRMQDWRDVLTQINDMASIGGEVPSITEDTSTLPDSPTETSTASGPDDDAIEGYKLKASIEGEAAAKTLWDKYYKGQPYPKVD